MIKENAKNTNSILTNTINNDTINTEATDSQVASYAVNAVAATPSSTCVNNNSPCHCGNDMSTAIELKFFKSMSGTISCPEASMWYKFTANASAAHVNGGTGIYIIKTESALDTIGHLYNSRGEQIDYGEDNGLDLDFRIQASLNYGETYYVRVTTYDMETGDYKITVTYSSVDDGTDDSNILDGVSEFIELPINRSKSGTIGCVTDKVWYKFTANAKKAHSNGSRGRYTIRTLGTVDTKGYLYDADGNEIDNDDDGGLDMNFSISTLLSYNKTYYICVETCNDDTGDYNIMVSYTPASAGNITNISGSGEDMSNAITLPLDMWLDGSICCPESAVWYKFVANDNAAHSTGKTVKYEISAQGALHTKATLYDRDGNQLELKTNGGYDNNFQIYRELSQGATYYIKLETMAQHIGYYSIGVTAKIAVNYVVIENKPPIMIRPGETFQLSASVDPWNATNKNIIWMTSDSRCADVGTFTGIVTAKKEGTVTITAMSSDDHSKTHTRSIKVVEYCGGTNYTDVAQHKLILQDDGYYVCSECGYRIKSPILQDKDILSTEDYYKVISCYLATGFSSTVENNLDSNDPLNLQGITTDKLLYIIDDIRSKDEYADKYEYVGANGIYQREYTTLGQVMPTSISVSYSEITKGNLLFHNGVAEGLINFACGFFVPPEYACILAAATSGGVYDGITFLSSYLLDIRGYTALSKCVELIALSASADDTIRVADKVIYISSGIVNKEEIKIIYSKDGEFKRQEYSEKFFIVVA